MLLVDSLITSPQQYNTIDIPLLPPLNSSLLFFGGRYELASPLWLYAEVSDKDSASSEAIVTLLLWPSDGLVNDTHELDACVGMSHYNLTHLSYLDPLSPTPPPAAALLLPLSAQRNGGRDSVLISPLAQLGYYGLLITNLNATTTHSFTVAISPHSAQPNFATASSADTFNFTLASLGLFLLFLLLSSLCLACLVLGRRYLATFRRKGGKKYHGVNKTTEGDARGEPTGAAMGGVLEGRMEGGDGMDSWDAEMKEMDSLELQLSEDGEQDAFELNEISTIYRQPATNIALPPQQQQQPQSQFTQTMLYTDGSGKRSPMREETKTNGSSSSNGAERAGGSPTRAGNASLEASRQSPPPIAQPVMQPVVESQRAQSASSSGKKTKKKKRRDDGGEGD